MRHLLPKDLLTLVFEFDPYYKRIVYDQVMFELNSLFQKISEMLVGVSNMGYDVLDDFIRPQWILHNSYAMSEYRRTGRLYCILYKYT
jgi:hypothetical protein